MAESADVEAADEEGRLYICYAASQFNDIINSICQHQSQTEFPLEQHEF